MAMDHIGAFARLEQELHRRLAKEGEAQRIVVKPVERPAIEEVVLGMGFDEEALTPMDEPEPDGTEDLLIVPRDPELFPDLVKAPDLVVPHAVVFGQDDLDRATADFQLAAQPKKNISKPPDLRHGSQFRRNHCNEHAGPSFRVCLSLRPDLKPHPLRVHPGPRGMFRRDVRPRTPRFRTPLREPQYGCAAQQSPHEIGVDSG